MQKTAQAIRKVSKKYLSILNRFQPDQFTLRPEADRWSPAEVYHHAFDSSILSLQAIDAIGAGVDHGGDASLVGKGILLTGIFPPGIRFKAPTRLLERLQSIPYADTPELIRTFEEKLEKSISIAGQADPALRIKHPRLGNLNAAQWLRFTEVHLKHHVKQVEQLMNYKNK